MKQHSGGLRLSATDLSNHLSCRHLTSLDLQVLHGKRPEPKITAPDLAVLQKLGKRHEAAYLDHLRGKGWGSRTLGRLRANNHSPKKL